MVLIAQLSDTHITAGGDATSDGSSGPVRALRAAVSSLLALPARPDCVVVTGDLTEHGRPAEYAALRRLLSPLPMPVHVLPGNHDDRTALRAEFRPGTDGATGGATGGGVDDAGNSGTDGGADGGTERSVDSGTDSDTDGAAARSAPVQYAVPVAEARLVCCDSTVPGRPHGTLDQARLDWLDRMLAAAPRTPTVVALHHPPFRIGVRFIDDMSFTGPEPFAAVVRRHPQVVRVISGHVHRGSVSSFAGTVATTCPSTYQQLYLDLSRPGRGAITGEPGGFALHLIEHDSAVTHFVPVDGHPPVLEIG